MVALCLALSLIAPPSIGRDSFGVPQITASSVVEAYQFAGYAVAEDRLWQMENSRRLSRGKMAEVFGTQFVASDTEVLKSSYTDEELQTQLDAMPPETRAIFASYVRGVNEYIEAAKAAGTLPPGYAEHGFQPEPWSELDSAAIAIRLFHLFGKGGAGEIRNLALVNYLQGQEKTKDKALDIFDDFAWQNDPDSLTTVLREDDPLAKKVPEFPNPTRGQTERQLAEIPKVGLLELLPGIRLAENTETRSAAERVSAPSKVGSYAIVVSPKRSSTGNALLLSGPQMGFQTPSVVHELSLVAPGYSVTGIDVPGMPGIAIGATPDLAWGLTSGVADTDDIFWFPVNEDGTYRYGSQNEELQTISRTLKVKGEADRTVIQKRTVLGPVVVESKAAKLLFARRSSYRGIELQSMEAIFGLANAKSGEQAEAAAIKGRMSFNFFYAAANGDIGYRYIGTIPKRPTFLDPRLPTKAAPENDWHGFYTPAEMPRVKNPKGGLILNWNNKPAAWWPNFDTPVWGHIFRNEALAAQLKGTKLSAGDLEHAVATIAKTDFTYPHFKRYFPKKQGLPSAELNGFGGVRLQGSVGTSIYSAFIDALREEVFLETTGNFMSMDNFRQIAQPSVISRALERRTKVDYLNSRKAREVADKAFGEAIAALTSKNGASLGSWGHNVGAITWKGADPVPYSDRGTYIQILEMSKPPVGRNVLAPGIAERGLNSLNQVPLARAWDYKPMVIRPRPN